MGSPWATLPWAPFSCTVSSFFFQPESRPSLMVSSGMGGTWAKPSERKMLRSPVRVPASQESMVQALATSGNPPPHPHFPKPGSPDVAWQWWRKRHLQREKPPDFFKITIYYFSRFWLGRSLLASGPLSGRLDTGWPRKASAGWLSSALHGFSSPGRPTRDGSHGNGKGPREHVFKLLIAQVHCCPIVQRGYRTPGCL